LVKDIPYFKERGMNDEAILEVIKVMKLMTVPSGKNVVEYGDIGENFYFILHGKVDI
jgi:CRP-like cAMP-binding protein